MKTHQNHCIAGVSINTMVSCFVYIYIYTTLWECEEQQRERGARERGESGREGRGRQRKNDRENIIMPNWLMGEDIL